MVNDDDSRRESEKEDRAIIERVLRELYSHFDTVQIFVTRLEPGDNTIGGAFGRGNSFARRGQVSDWLENGGVFNLDDFFSLDDEDDGESWEPVEE